MSEKSMKGLALFRMVPVGTQVGVAGSARRRRPGRGGLGRHFLGRRRFRFGGGFSGGTRLHRRLRLLHFVHVLRLRAL